MNKWLNAVALKILAHIQERKSITFYYRKLDLSAVATNKAMNELHSKGLIQKKVNGREKLIILTPRGQVAQDQIWALNRLLG